MELSEHALPRPTPAQVWRAIDVYLEQAYAGRPPPRRVDTLLSGLRAASDDHFYEAEALEREPQGEPARYALRLGNRRYPHMKLVIERLPSGRAWFFCADTHDRHVRAAPEDPDHDALTALVSENRAIAQRIEGAWTDASIDTFRAFLRRDLDTRRRQAT